MRIDTLPISKIHINTGQIKDVPKNPRFIKGERFCALKKSIRDDPEMLSIRELVVYDNGNEQYVLIMGNMRYRAMKDLGYKEARCKILQHDTPAKKIRAFIQKDNIPFGQNDWESLANEWGLEELQEFGLECDFLNVDERDVDVFLGGGVNKAEGENEILQICVPFQLKGQLGEIRESVQAVIERFAGVYIK